MVKKIKISRSVGAPVLLLWCIGLLFLFFAPKIFSEYGIHIAIIATFYAVMASSWNLVAGFTGQVSFATAAFAGLGAYTSFLLQIKVLCPIWVSVIVGGCVAALMGILLGSICLRMGGKTLSMVTLGFSEIIRLILTNEDQWTRGTQGLQVIPTADAFQKDQHFGVMVLFLLLVLTAIRYIQKSALGLRFRAVLNDEVAAASLGVNVMGVRVQAFGISSLFAGIAGALYVQYLGIVTPDIASLDEVFIVLAMAMLGGKGTWLGPVVGAVVVEVLSEQIRVYGNFHLLVFGIITLLMIRFGPTGRRL